MYKFTKLLAVSRILNNLRQNSKFRRLKNKFVITTLNVSHPILEHHTSKKKKKSICIFRWINFKYYDVKTYYSLPHWIFNAIINSANVTEQYNIPPTLLPFINGCLNNIIIGFVRFDFFFLSLNYYRPYSRSFSFDKTRIEV